ncbi:MAG: M4 family metallopeptidase [Acidobacteria bacterium]|nr:M4 family metallopeptidase [Acidobacteriota bacterium]
MKSTLKRGCFIIPPYILRALTQNGTKDQQDMAWRTLTKSEQARGERVTLTTIASLGATATGVKRRTVYDAQNKTGLPGRLVRSEGDPKIDDISANEAYDGSGLTYDFFLKVYDRNSIDDRGMRLDSTVHYELDFDNAFWNGRQMVYGDGDGEIFQRFTRALDVIGHELTHGITQFEAALDYEDQPGALNESFSDVLGSLVLQYKKRQTADQAEWLIGKGLLTRRVKGVALRSMKAPGTAYDDPLIGKDPQPGHMRGYVDTSDDNGGVHINSGIPNKAFYEAAIRIGGHAWEKAGRIWYLTLRDRLRHDSTFGDAARLTVDVASALHGPKSLERNAVREAWESVGITVR